MKKLKAGLAEMHKLESVSYNKGLMQGRGISMTLEKGKERESRTYQKYFEALEHINSLKADLVK